MKYIIGFTFFFLASIVVYSQNSQSDDIQTPGLSSFNLSNPSLQGVISSTVKEVTGKVSTSFPITNISARAITFPVALTYIGDNVFEQAQEMNKFSPQGILGIGWSMSTPKIITDHKGTTNRDDDVFYLLDGNNNTRLFNTKKNIVDAPVTGDSYMDFEMEKFMPYKVRYKISNADFISGIYTVTDQDYWEVTDDKGITYIYGEVDNSKQNVIAWGNWIGDSDYTSGATKHTTAWNLYKIQDQWGNHLTFSYDKIEEGINLTGPKHTEASYLKEIVSSTGEKVKFYYSNKGASEFYEPHAEQSEPDAYQERYEKKYLNNVNTHDTNGYTVYQFKMDYNLVTKSSSSEQNRYLVGITQKDIYGQSLPSQEFEYYTNGNYEGGLNKITYPSGGSVTYSYDEQTIFDSTSPTTITEGTISSGGVLQGEFAGNNYALKLYSNTIITGLSILDYSFRVVNRYWTGQKWKINEFVIPEQIRANSSSIDNLRFVSGDNFYAFLTFDRTANQGNVYLFHKNNDGITWDFTQYQNINLNSNNNNNLQFSYKDPILMAGEDFVAIGENESANGRLYTYVWNGDGWNSQTINQGIGTYYYGASNNFIISLDENGNGTDLVTGNTHPDYYYIHYLDAERNWNTKSWSSVIDNTYTFVAPTNDPSYLYPSNNMVGFMADNNPEYIIRWDNEYNIVAIDDVFGSYDDSYPFIPIGSNNFSVFFPHANIAWTGTLAYHKKSAAFNGNSWSVQDFTSNFGQGSGINLMLTNRYINGISSHWWYRYNPNTHQWLHLALPVVNQDNVDLNGYGVNSHFMLAGQYSYYIGNNGSRNLLEKIYHGIVDSRVVNNGNEMFVEYRGSTNTSSSEYYHSFILSINKKNNTINAQTIQNGDIYSSLVEDNLNIRSRLLGGALPMLGRNILNTGSSTGFKKVIDGQINKVVKDVIVSGMEINDGFGQIREVSFTYNNPHTLPDDKSTFYGEFIAQNKGLGTGNIGQTKKYFNTGIDDIQMAGILTKEVMVDKNGVIVSEMETEWEKYIKNLVNSDNKTIGLGYYLRPKKTIEKLVFGTQEVITETDNLYNSLGYLTSSSRLNSKGENEVKSITYAYQNYTFVNDKNMLRYPYEAKTEINGTSVSVEQSIWKLSAGKAYSYLNKSGPDVSSLRDDYEITMVDSYGNVLESNNGKGIYETVLYGYQELFPVATVNNAKYQDVVNELDVSYSQLQNLSTLQLAAELPKIAERLPDASSIIKLYDAEGRIVKTIDERRESISTNYDSFGRFDHTTDANGNVLLKSQYYFVDN